jgi:hypothetical protein
MLAPSRSAEVGEWGDENDSKATTLEAAEKELKELMADAARAMEKAQQAVARITGKATAIAPETEATTPSH